MKTADMVGLGLVVVAAGAGAAYYYKGQKTPAGAVAPAPPPAYLPPSFAPATAKKGDVLGGIAATAQNVGNLVQTGTSIFNTVRGLFG